MTRSTFHARTVERSPELQRIVDVLRSAAAPLSALEIMLKIKEKYERDALNVSTGIGEIRTNDDHAVVTLKPKRKGEQYRYVLLRAPGWTPTWQQAYAPDSSLSVDEADADGSLIELVTSYREDLPIQEEERDRPPRICKLDGCFREIPESGPPFCSQEHRDKFFGGNDASH